MRTPGGSAELIEAILLLDSLDDGGRVRSEELDDHSRDDFAFAVSRLEASPDGTANLDVSDLGEKDGRAVFGL